MTRFLNALGWLAWGVVLLPFTVALRVQRWFQR